MEKQLILANKKILLLHGLVILYVSIWLWCYWWRLDFWWTRTFFDPEDFSRYFQLAQDHWYQRVIHTEYPPLAIWFFYWPLYFTKNLFYYSQIISGQLLLIYSLTIYFFYKFSLLYLPPVKKKIWLLLLLPSFIYFSLNRFDIFPVLFILLSFFALQYHRFKIAVGLFGVAILFKLYPILLLPLVFTYIYKIGGKRVAFYSSLLIVILLGFVYTVYGYIYGWPAIWQPFFIYLARTDFYGSWLWAYSQIIGSSVYSITLWVKAVAIFGFIFFYSWWFYYFLKNKNIQIFQLFSAAAIVLIWYHLFTSFYSPQWWLWYLPLLVLFIRRSYDVVMLVIYDLLNYIQFPLLFNINPESQMMVVVVMIRTLLLVYIGYRVFISLLKSFKNSNYALDYTADLQ
jgi:hypothetical protein